MKNKILYLIVFLIFPVCLFAQDLIVTTAGDSIQCRVTRRNADFIYFVFSDQGKANSTLLHNSKVSAVRKAYYRVDKTPEIILGKKELDFSRWRYGFHGGYTYRTAKIHDQITGPYREFNKKLKSGITLGGDMHYFVSEPIGIGLKYGFSKFNASLESGYKEDIAMHNISVSVLNRYILKDERNRILLGFNIGFQSYKNKIYEDVNKGYISGSTAGFGMEVGYDRKLSKSTALHFGVAYLAGNLYKIKVNDGYQTQSIKLDKGEYESLSRLELSIGLKFGK